MSHSVLENIKRVKLSEPYLKERLALMLIKRIEQEGWNQKQAAEVLGFPRNRVCQLLLGQYKNFSITKLFEGLESIGFTCLALEDSDDFPLILEIRETKQ